MKKSYKKPVFIAEEYIVLTSIATCTGASSNTPIEMEYNENYCDHGSSCTKGHSFTEKHASDKTKQYYKEFTKDYTHAYLFTSSNDICEFKWDSVDGNVMPMDESFSKAFYGNGSDNGGHKPGYNGAAFFS